MKKGEELVRERERNVEKWVGLVDEMTIEEEQMAV